MGKIDQELSEALQHAEAQGIATADVPPAAVTPQPQRNVGLLIGLLVAVGVLLTAFAYVPMEALFHATDVDKLHRERDTAGTKTFTLQGRLVSGSMQFRQTPCEHRFRLSGATHQISVHYPSCILPDTVRDLRGRHVDITATGTLAADGHFQAKEVIGKCPSKEGYQADRPRPELIEPVRID